MQRKYNFFKADMLVGNQIQNIVQELKKQQIDKHNQYDVHI
jgi:hypothetical protein